MPWHPISEPPEYGANVVLRGKRGGMYLGHRASWKQQGGDYYYIPNSRHQFMYEDKVVAWHEIEEYEGQFDG